MKTLLLFLLVILCTGCQPANVGDSLTDETEGGGGDSSGLVFVEPSSDEVVRFAREKSAAIPIKTTILNDDIYGTRVPQGRKVGGEFPYRLFSETDQHDFRIKDANELAETRYGLVWMAYRRHWREQDGWQDHVYNLSFCRDLPVDAAQFPQTAEEWRSGDVIVGLRLVYPNTKKGIEEATRRLRDCASKCLEFAKQNKIADDLKIELYLELYDACEFPSSWSRRG